MASLDRNLRKQLESTVKEARRVAEAGAQKALEQLAVHHHEPWPSLTPDQRGLRNRLRAHGRQLGDQRDERRGTQAVARLKTKCAYEHWHRMLFARFLADSNLLIEPATGVAISLAECQELARERGEDWLELASAFAERMLPQIFRKGDPVLEVTLPPETRSGLEDLLKALPRDVFLADDSLGWVYQFWQTEQKDKVNAYEKKIGADELPAVTQLFTEDYMVLFLLHNTLGAWWAGKVAAASSRWSSCTSEEECRSLCALPGVDWQYLRFIKVEAASSRSDGEFGFYRKDDPIANLAGNLPHWRQEGVTYFVTFRSADSLPEEKLRQWKAERTQWLAEHPEPHDEETREQYHQRFTERIERWIDQGYGACALKEPELRGIVENALRSFEGVRYDLDRFVVAANHVHILVTPRPGYELSDILHSWKSFTANQLNRRLGQPGAFWQKESFDHIVRSPAQLERFRAYIDGHVAAASSRRGGILQADVAAASSCGDDLQPDNKRLEAASTWRPAAGTFDGWPRFAREITLLDPCMGSGHFLVFALPMLVAFRMTEEDLSRDAAVEAVLRDNLFGLEVDPRCTQIAAFNLALAAWRIVSYRALPRLNLACSGLSLGVGKDEWLTLAGDVQRLRTGMERLYHLFEKAPVLGSLINPHTLEGDLLEAEFPDLQPLLEQALAGESRSGFQPLSSADKRPEAASTLTEVAVTAHGLVTAAEILGSKFTLVATNVPYLGRGKQDDVLKDYCERVHPQAKADLATCFVERCLDSCAPGGCAAIVTQQSWLFLTTYKQLRPRLLRERTWGFVARLGPGAFETISGEVVSVALLGIGAAKPAEAHTLVGIEASEDPTPKDNAERLRVGPLANVNQKRILENPDAVVTFEAIDATKLLGRYAGCFQGTSTGDNARLTRTFWELPAVTGPWRFFQGPPAETRMVAGREFVVDWSTLEAGFEAAAIRGSEAWNKRGVGIGQMSGLPATLYGGTLFSNSTPVIIPARDEYLTAVWTFCSSPDFNAELRKLNPKVSVDNGYVSKVPFDLTHWQRVAAQKYPDGLPESVSDDPTQWLFDGHPARASVEAASSRLYSEGQRPKAAAVLQVAVARLLAYRWPRQTGSSFPDCPSVVADGLESHADADGIVCLSPLKGEPPAAERLNALLADAFGPQWSAARLATLLKNVGAGGGTPPPRSLSLDDWLRDGFFAQHCELFHQRPFVWHVRDGRRDGFHALVNYHRLCGEGGSGVSPLGGDSQNKRLEAASTLLQKLIYSYLGDWIDRQRGDQKAGVEGADARLAAAEHLKKELEKILAGEPPYDIFVRWKPLHKQPIGWEPDINDGVRINIRPFMMARPLGARSANACILRTTPRINWNKDRGREPHRDREDFPWFWGWDGETVDCAGGKHFDGNRWNDLHYTAAFKRAARERYAQGTAGGSR